MKNSSFYAGVIIFGIIFSLAFISTRPMQAGILGDYDPDEEGYWGMNPEDVLIYAIYDSTNFSNSKFNTKHYALMKNEILSTNDQAMDEDTIPDLLLNSYFLMGNEEIKVSLGQYLDLSILSPILAIAGAMTPSGNKTTFILPTFPSVHLVNSELLGLLNDISEPFFYGGGIPLFSFEMGTAGQTFSEASWTNYAVSPNTITYETGSGARNWSNCLKFALNNNSRNLGMRLTNFPVIENSGAFSFWYHPSIAVGEEMIVYSQYDPLGGPTRDDWNGIIMGVNRTGVYTYEGQESWFDNGMIQTWIPNVNFGNWSYVAPVNTYDWTLINCSYQNDYTKPLSVTIDKGTTYPANFTVSHHAYAFKNSKIQFDGNGTNGANAFIDDYTVSFSSSGGPTGILEFLTFLLTVLPLDRLLQLASIYNLLYQPQVLNWDAFQNLIGFVLDQLFNFLGTSFSFNMSDPSILHRLIDNLIINTPSEFSLFMNGTELWGMLESVLGFIGLNVTLMFAEGHANWYFKTTWDKENGCLNQSIFHVNYLDLNMTREIGLKLITSRSVNPVLDGYYYYSGTWMDEDYYQISRPFARQLSRLNNDSYPSHIPDEWNLFSPSQITEAFLNEFDYNTVLLYILQENGWMIALLLIGVIGASVGAAFGFDLMFRKIAARRKAK